MIFSSCEILVLTTATSKELAGKLTDVKEFVKEVVKVSNKELQFMD